MPSQTTTSGIKASCLNSDDPHIAVVAVIGGVPHRLAKCCDAVDAVAVAAVAVVIAAVATVAVATVAVVIAAVVAIVCCCRLLLLLS